MKSRRHRAIDISEKKVIQFSKNSSKIYGKKYKKRYFINNKTENKEHYNYMKGKYIKSLKGMFL